MARIPRRFLRTKFTQARPQSETSAGSGFALLASAFDQANSVLAPLAEADAVARGSSAVSRDADGNLSVGERIPFTKLDQLHNAAAGAVYITELEQDHALELDRLQHEFRGDAAGFNQAATQLRERMIATAPDVFKGDVAKLTAGDAVRRERAIVSDQRKTTTARAENSINASIERKRNQALELARNPNAENRAELDTLNEEIRDLARIKAGMPGSTMSEEDILLHQEMIIAEQNKISEAQITSRFDDHLDVVERGGTPNDPDLEAQFSDEQKRQLQIARGAVEFEPTFNAMGPAARLKVIGDIRAGAENEQVLDIRDNLIKKHEKMLVEEAKDPIAAAQGALGSLPSIDPASGATFKDRVAVARHLQENGRNNAARYFSDDEQVVLSEVLKGGDAAEVATTIRSIAEAGQSASDMVQELNLGAGLEFAVLYGVNGGAASTVEKMIDGDRVTGRTSVGAEVRKNGVDEVFGGVPMPVQARDQIIHGAELIYKSEMSRNPGEPEEVWIEALREASGLTGQAGGIQEINGKEVYVAPGISGSEVSRRVQSHITRRLSVPHAAPARVRLTDQQKLENETARREHDMEFWGGVSGNAETGRLDGGYPTFNQAGRPLSYDEWNETEMVPTQNGWYGISIRRNGEVTFLRDSVTGQPFQFRMDKLAVN